MLLAMPRLGRLNPWQQAAFFIVVLYFLLFHLRPATQSHFEASEESDTLPEVLNPRRRGPTYSYSPDLTTNLIIASTAKDNITWTSDLLPHLPNLKIYRYVSDSAMAQFQPAVLNKGREALMYLTYMRDFHNLDRTPNSEDDGLADINIFIHAEEFPWHGDLALMKSMLFTLAQLDLQHVLNNGYVNLRTSWGGSGEHNCPDGGFNTSTTFEENPLGEEYFMREAFTVNFPGEEVPEILAGPCCSQFAVAKEAIRGRDRQEYERAVNWLVETPWVDQLVGRVWEHMWVWLFKRIARDCGSEEWRSLCAQYGVCFEGSEGLKRYEELWVERKSLKEGAHSFWRELLRPGKVAEARGAVQTIGAELEELLVGAVGRGRDQKVRKAMGGTQAVRSPGPS